MRFFPEVLMVLPVMAILCLAGCGEEQQQLTPLTPSENVTKLLQSQGLHVLDTDSLGTVTSLCLTTAATGVGFRAQDGAGHSIHGVACVYEDNSASIVMKTTMATVQ